MSMVLMRDLYLRCTLRLETKTVNKVGEGGSKTLKSSFKWGTDGKHPPSFPIFFVFYPRIWLVVRGTRRGFLDSQLRRTL